MQSNPQVSLLSLEEAVKTFRYFHKKNPTFGMDITVEGFKPEGIVVAQRNESYNKSNPAKFDFYALVLCLYGELHRKINQYDYTIQKYSLQLIPPNTITSFECKNDKTITYILAFSEEFIQFLDNESNSELIQSLLDYHQNNFDNVVLPKHAYTRVKNIYESINAELYEKQEDYLVIIKLLIMKLLFILKRHKEIKTPHIPLYETKGNKIAHEYLNLVEKHFIERRQVSDYAKLLDITSKHLSETIKKVLGKRALYYIHNRILKEAQYLLEYTDFEIVKIASILNFHNQSVFTKFFKATYAMTPTEYRLISKQSNNHDLLCKKP